MQRLLEHKDMQGRHDASYMDVRMRIRRRLFSIASWGPCLAIGVVALLLNLYRLGEPSLWFDEVLSVVRAEQPLTVVSQIIFSTQPNMALYYVLLHFWLDLTHWLGFLPTEFVVRLPSTIFAALGSVMLFLFGKRFLSLRAGFFGAGLYLLNAHQLTYAQQTRSYSLQLLLICASWYVLCTLLLEETGPRRRRWLWWAGYGLLSTLAVYTHLVSGLIILAQVLVFGCLMLLPTPWRSQARRQWGWLLGSLAGAGVLLLPLVPPVLGGGRTEWLPSPELSNIRDFFVAIVAGNDPYLVLLGLCWLFGVAFVICCSLPGVRSWLTRSSLSRFLNVEGMSRNFPVLIVLLGWFVIPFATSYVISQGETHIFSSRYMVIVLPALMLLAALFIDLLLKWWMQIVVAVGVLVIAFASVPYYYQSAQVEDWKPATFWLQDHYRSGDGMVCYNNGQGCQISIDYYLRAYPRGVSFPADSPGTFSWVDYDLTDQVHATSDALDPVALQAYAARHSRLFFIAGRLDGDDDVALVQKAESWLDQHYHLVDQFVTPSVTIRLYQIAPA